MKRIFKVILVFCFIFTSMVSAQPINNSMKHSLFESTDLEYEIQGTGEAVLLIHGAGVAAAFSPLMKEDALTNNYQLIRYHRQGFADSSFPNAPFSIQDQANDAAMLLQSLGVDKVHVVGHSLGGAIAFQLSLDYPELVHSLVLLEPGGIRFPGATPPIGLISALDQYMSGDAEGAIDTMFEYVFGGEWPDGTESAVPGGPDQARKDAKNTFEIEVPAMMEWQFAEEEAKYIFQPVLFILGGSELWGRGIKNGIFEINITSIRRSYTCRCKSFSTITGTRSCGDTDS